MFVILLWAMCLTMTICTSIAQVHLSLLDARGTCEVDEVSVLDVACVCIWLHYFL